MRGIAMLHLSLETSPVSIKCILKQGTVTVHLN